MTESDWKRSHDPEAMLFLVAPTLSRRQWNLLGCAVVRQVWDLLLDEELRQLVNRIESHVDYEEGERAFCTSAQLEAWQESAMAAGVREQSTIFRANGLDTDSLPRRAWGSEVNSVSACFYRGATDAARVSIRDRRFAVQLAGQAVELLYRGLNRHPDLEEMRGAVRIALESRSSTNLHTVLALKLKVRGDRSDDAQFQYRGRGSRSTVLADIERERNASFQRSRTSVRRIRRAEEQAMGRLLHDLCGNPFQPDRFQARWRTETVIGLASAIARDGRYDRLPILADALVEAGCDDEEMLRHCLGTGTDGKAAIHHAGCWVLDRILNREDRIVIVLPLRKRRARAIRQTRDAERNAAVS